MARPSLSADAQKLEEGTVNVVSLSYDIYNAYAALPVDLDFGFFEVNLQ